MTLEDGECQSIGSRLRAIENTTVDAVFNDALDFTVSDWILEGAYYTLTYTPLQHGSGALPMLQIYEKIGLQYHFCMVDSIILQAGGTFKLRTLANPDLRFNGRIIVDE